AGSRATRSTGRRRSRRRRSRGCGRRFTSTSGWMRSEGWRAWRRDTVFAMSRRDGHIPVLAAEVLSALRPRPGMRIADCTLGLGGHAAMLLEQIAPGGTLVGCDFDPRHVELAREALGLHARAAASHSSSTRWYL